MNGDKSNPTTVHIFDAATSSWSAQSVTASKFDPSNFNAILDHDTNVFYALSNGEVFFLDMGQMTAANATALSWTDVGQSPYGATYQPVMALAQNHIHFLDVPGVPAGNADIFVIHCMFSLQLPVVAKYSPVILVSYFQPQPQPYPLPDGSTFPATHGQTASFFQDSGVQQEFAFIPDDGSATYVINVENNSTAPLAGPSTKDPKATYTASITALVQLDSTGALSFLPYKQGDSTTNSAAKWSSVANVAAVVPPGSATSSSSSSASSSGSHPSGTQSSANGKPTSVNGTSTGSNAQNSGASIVGTSVFGLTLIALGSLGFVASLL
jgi:hypothetical protein